VKTLGPRALFLLKRIINAVSSLFLKDNYGYDTQ